MSSITTFPTAIRNQDAEREQMRNNLKYHLSMAALQRLRDNKEITRREHEQAQAILARKYHREGTV